jgi:hypothetical protein
VNRVNHSYLPNAGSSDSFKVTDRPGLRKLVKQLEKEGYQDKLKALIGDDNFELWELSWPRLKYGSELVEGSVFKISDMSN